MSLKVLLRCSDPEFERLIAMMDLESILDIISELQTEMDKEQEIFDGLSIAITKITDQASAEFKKVSQNLVKSQNRLALLMSRNMHCFKMSHEFEDDEAQGKQNGQNVEKDNSKLYTIPESCDQQKENVEPSIEANNLTKGSKVTAKNGLDSPKVNNLKHNGLKITNGNHSNHPREGGDNSKDSESLNCNVNQLSSTATFTVISPRQTPDQTKPKRILKVRTTSLSSDSSTCSTPRSPVSKHDGEKTTADPALYKNLNSQDNPAVSGNMTSKLDCPRSSLYAARERYFSSLQSEPDKKPAVNSNVQSWPKSETCHKPEPISPVNSFSSPRSISDIYLSPRSDVGNTATSPRTLLKDSLTVSNILELDIPETSIDDDGWVGSANTPGGSEGVSDKLSCTTDESGFTSASSESDSTLTPPDVVYDYHSEEDEKVEERVFMKSWNPRKLLETLYEIKLAQEISTETFDVINMEGYLERLPLGKNKNTLLKTWKRTYCKAVDGIMYFYNRKDSSEAQSYMSLMGGVLEELSNRMIGIDDMRGHYLMVRCPSEIDLLNWKKSFCTQIKCSPLSSYVRPCLNSRPSPSGPKVIVIDLGSTSVRAGILGSSPSYPQLFFPCISSTDAKGQTVIGFDAYKPENRANGLHYPIASCKEIDMYRVNVQVLPDIFKTIFTELQVDVQNYMVMLSCPHNFSGRLKEEVINILIGRFNAAGVNMVNQSLLIPYSYNATSGIVVDIGERIEIVAITDGYLVDNGLNRQSYGGSRITETLNSYLVEYRLFTPVEQLIARHLKEKTCFVSQDYGDDLLKYMCNDSACELGIDLNQFDLPEGSHMKQISVDTARFKAPEGLIKTELLGIDSPTLPKLIDQAVQKCPMDVRREMWQSIYLSGGATLIDGFPERLQKELGKIAPSSITIQVHASPYRYHAAYIGACMLAKLPNFTSSCITRAEWRAQGISALCKWKSYFQG